MSIAITLELPSDYLKVYIRETAYLEDERTYQSVYDSLPDFRKQAADRLKNRSVRLQSVAAFDLLSEALRDLGVDTGDKECWTRLKFSVTDKGKPYFAGRNDIRFSLSHTGGAVMCVVSGSECGCDIEKADRTGYLDAIAKRVFSPRELKEYLDDPDIFFKLWTKKEAYAKYTGEGIAQLERGFCSYELDEIFSYYEYDGYVATVCVGRTASES